MVFHHLYEIKMKIANKVPYLVIDDVLSDENLIGVWKTIDSLDETSLHKPYETGSKMDHTSMGMLTAKENSGVFLNDLFSEKYRHQIPLYRAVDQLRETVRTFHDCHPALRTLGQDTESHLLLSYYKNGDHYKKHMDNSLFTILLWLHKDPKTFEGGDLVLEDEDTVEFRNNRAVVIPSYCEHEVLPVTGEGRWCLSIFCNYPFGLDHKKNLTSCPQPL